MSNEEIIATLGPELVEKLNKLIYEQKYLRKSRNKVLSNKDLTKIIASFFGGKTKRRKNRKVKTLKRKRT